VKVEVIRSARRRKTVSARKVGDALRVSIPAWMSVAEEQACVEDMVRRMRRREAADRFDLDERARLLSLRFGLRRPESIRWVSNQGGRWGSCTPADGTIRISDRLAKEPAWVVDYVLVHELAHLSVHGHTAAFWELVYRYPLCERARGYLMARGLEGDDPDETSGVGGFGPLDEMASAEVGSEL
jgi:predicted metal-dependent hydrolase